MHWLKGLIAAIISAAANTITASIVDPVNFPLSDFKKIGTFALVSGLIGAAMYLKQSPIPKDDDKLFVRPTLRSLLLPLVLAASLSAPACAARGSGVSGPDQFFIVASRANNLLATNTRSLHDTLVAANQRDCAASTPGLQPCLSDSDFATWKRGLFVASGYGQALSQAIRAANASGVSAQAQAIIAVLDGLLRGDTLKLSAEERTIAVAVLTAARGALLVLLPTGGVE
jgi:hypothetical protein